MQNYKVHYIYITQEMYTKLNLRKKIKNVFSGA